jgi:hypothetical protein
LGFMRTDNANGLPISDNAIWAYNTQRGIGVVSGTAAQFGNLSTEVIGGFAIVQNLIEMTIEGQAALQVSYDGNAAASNNIIIWNNTVVGNRVNFGYNDGTALNQGTSYLHKNWSVVGNLFYEINNKDDVFAAIGQKTITAITKANPAIVTTSSAHGLSNNMRVYLDGITDVSYASLNSTTFTVKNKTENTFELYNASGDTAIDMTGATADCPAATYACGSETVANPARVGGWPVGYKVGFYGNVFKETHSGDWFGESTGLCSTAESSAIFNFYKDATDSTGDSTGINGDYHNNSNASAYNFIPLGKNVLPYDLDGKRRRTEADDAGCYVRGLKVY